jgi:hypothetical protein
MKGRIKMLDVETTLEKRVINKEIRYEKNILELDKQNLTWLEKMACASKWNKRFFWLEKRGWLYMLPVIPPTLIYFFDYSIGMLRVMFLLIVVGFIYDYFVDFLFRYSDEELLGKIKSKKIDIEKGVAKIEKLNIQLKAIERMD